MGRRLIWLVLVNIGVVLAGIGSCGHSWKHVGVLDSFLTGLGCDGGCKSGRKSGCESGCNNAYTKTAVGRNRS